MNQNLNIIYEDDDVIVIHKPAGIVVHPIKGHEDERSLIGEFLKRNPKIKNVGDDKSRPGIVHRLDKDVSGLIVVAKNQNAFDSLKTQFQNRTIQKEYIALVYGKLPKDHDMITFKIARSKASGKMVARPQAQEGKEAITEYDVLKRFKNHTLVRVTLHTGRTHQIRVHFLSIDHPLVGDKLYRKKRMKNIRPIEMDRVFLHANKLGFRLPDGTEKMFESPLPEELENLLPTLAD